MQDALLFLFLLFFISAQNEIKASEIRSTSQLITIRRPGSDKIGKQQDLQGKILLNRKLSLGVTGTYLERFDLIEKRAGASVAIRPGERLSLEVGIQKGHGNEILPETEIFLQSYINWKEGLTPFFIYRDLRYSLTHLHALNLGMEIEKMPKIILIPMALVGKATFSDPATTRDIFSAGFRISYYTEMKYSVSVFTNKGKEASQGIVGRSTRLVDTFSGGASFLYYILPELKAELTFDHTNYEQLRTQFHTTMINLTWML